MNDSRVPLPVIHREPVSSRRDFLARAGGGFGLLALLSLMAPEAAAADWEDDQPAHPLAPRPPHFKAKAKRVIWCFLDRSEEHTSELQSHLNLVCRLLLEKKNKTRID